MDAVPAPLASAPITKDSKEQQALTAANLCALSLQSTMQSFCEQTLMKRLNRYYDASVTPRFMLDDAFRDRLDRLKGLCAFPIGPAGSEEHEWTDCDDRSTSNPSKSRAKKARMKRLSEASGSSGSRSPKSSSSRSSAFKKKGGPKGRGGGKKEDLKSMNKSLFNKKGKSSMNYKFRAFTKSNQPNSFVTNTSGSDNDSKLKAKSERDRYHNRYHDRFPMHSVKADDMLIGGDAQIDMNELINGLVYSAEAQDHRIGTLNTAQNDYSQYAVDTRKRPQNFIREMPHHSRLSEYPKLRKLMTAKNEALRQSSIATPPFYVHADLKHFDLTALQTKFDVILVDPPWRLYHDRCPGALPDEDRTPWTVEEMARLRIYDVAENPSFLFLWCGSGTTLNDGRQLLKKWGYKRCEVIVWLKTNKKSQIELSAGLDGGDLKEFMLESHERKENGGGFVVQNEYDGRSYADSLFVRSYEHCLMGIRGQVRRSTDGHLIHANVDTDVIITESAPYGSTMKPKEIYDIIERFCMGRKRLELFGRRHNLRPGWVTVGNDEGIPRNSNYDSLYYNALFTPPNGARYVATSKEIENLRPKSPQRNSHKNNGNRGNGGNGAQSMTNAAAAVAAAGKR